MKTFDVPEVRDELKLLITSWKEVKMNDKKRWEAQETDTVIECY